MGLESVYGPHDGRHVCGRYFSSMMMMTMTVNLQQQHFRPMHGRGDVKLLVWSNEILFINGEQSSSTFWVVGAAATARFSVFLQLKFEKIVKL